MNGTYVRESRSGLGRNAISRALPRMATHEAAGMTGGLVARIGGVGLRTLVAGDDRPAPLRLLDDGEDREPRIAADADRVDRLPAGADRDDP
jgi:hypothetical protein